MKIYLLALGLCIAAGPVAAQTTLVMLGTGTPNADPERSGPSLALVVNGRVYLVDAGPGIVRRAAGAEADGVKELAQPNLSMVFLTHLHSDHTLGLPDLMLSPWVLERTAPLEVYGPVGTTNMVEHLQAAYAQDTQLRSHSLEPANQTGWKTNVHEIEPGIIFKDDNVTVTAFAVPHSGWLHSFGYTFQTADRRIVISGDTTPSEEVVRQCNGCDLLVHEVYSSEIFPKRPPEWQKYHLQAHTSTKELAAIAGRAHPKLLLLNHQLLWGTTDAALVNEIKAAGYAGEVKSAKDLQRY